jgi:hypothetical protein
MVNLLWSAIQTGHEVASRRRYPLLSLGSPNTGFASYHVRKRNGSAFIRKVAGRNRSSK